MILELGDVQLRLYEVKHEASENKPERWEEWITLPIRDQDEAVQTVRGRAPKEMRAMPLIRNSHEIADWRLFVPR